MTTFDTLIERNRDFAAHHFPKNVPLMPKAMIIGCVDHRVNPTHVLGVQAAQVGVIRRHARKTSAKCGKTRACRRTRTP